MNNKIIGAKTKFTKQHIPSIVNPDTLFTFTTDLRWLIESLELKMLSPRYNEEDISYLRSRKYRKLVVPMKCFCDINLSKLDLHMEWYGDYGLAFEKAWGIEHGLQPIQYINANSPLCNDLSTVFKNAVKDLESNDITKEKRLYTDLKNEMLLELLFKKPYIGKMEKRSDHSVKKKCLADEHEWRFIPDVTSLGLETVITDQNFSKEAANEYSNTMKGVKDVSLVFDYSDIKHIVIKNLEDYEKLITSIDKWDLDKVEQYTILSRIVVWDELKGDF